uniref:EF-hand domain-containing protein n=1 Tax=Leersia perrieri TaxID=77586 RepID=A0A0D9VP42_9ORYZ
MAGTEAFEAYFRRADLNQDGRISGQEAVAFFQGANLPQQVLAQVWMHADKNKTGFLGRPEFFNALRLVTVAQSGRQLTPDIVQSALFGPAAARIPPPKIAGGPSPTPQMGAAGAPRPQVNAVAAAPAPGQVAAAQPQMNAAGTPRPQGSGMMPNSAQFGGQQQVNAGAVPRPVQGINSMMPAASQGGALQPTQFAQPRGMQSQLPSMGFNQQPPPSSTGFMRPPQPGAPAGSLQAQAPGINQIPLGGSSTGGIAGWQAGNVGSVGGVPQANMGATARPQATPDGFGLALSSTMGMAPGQQAHGMPSSSMPPQNNSAVSAQDSKALVLSGNGSTSGSGTSNDIFSALTQPKSNVSTPSFPTSMAPNSSSFMSTPSGSRNLSNLSQFGSQQGTPTVSSGGSLPQQTHPITKPSVPTTTMPGVSAGVSSSASQWPKVTQSDIQKYTKVFGDVDRDRDGKITGSEARTLFLSWRLPREILKQVWDLSDQDNDGMLSLREFCIALYLMERHRAGTPLPPTLPDSLKYDEVLLRATGLPSTAYNGPSWQQNPGLTQKGPGAAGMPAAGVRPPMPPHLQGQMDGANRSGQPRSHMPGMDNHTAAQTNKDNKSGMNSAAQEVPDTSKKVEVEKLVLDSREKLEYYRTKMQDLVLYKSRCDNRLNEITERASSDKREVESLAKKYEEKYKQVAELASKLAVEEAQFRDVQERKVELHDALVKMIQGGSVDGLLQVRADRIQYQLEEMEKAFSERCKHFGLQFKPSASVELPFGWEPGKPEGAIEWDEDWDKFDDEGFGLVKDNGTIVENPVSSENVKVPSLWDDTDEVLPVASSNGHIKDERHYRGGDQAAKSELEYDFGEESVRSPSSAGRSASGNFIPQVTWHLLCHSDHGGSESIFGDKYADETSWNFDDQDTESVWGSNAMNNDHGSTHNSFFGSDDFGKKKSSFFDDSVPSSPAYTSGFSPKFSESRDDSSSYNFGKFDSFRSQESGFFPQESRFSRFDSVNSSKGENVTGFDSPKSSRNFGRFDSFDDADPFGSSGPFKASGSRSPPKF